MYKDDLPLNFQKVFYFDPLIVSNAMFKVIFLTICQ